MLKVWGDVSKGKEAEENMIFTVYDIVDVLFSTPVLAKEDMGIDWSFCNYTEVPVKSVLCADFVGLQGIWC